MRNFFQKIPFIRITSLFLIGILLNHFYTIEFHLLAVVVTILISVAILLWHNSNYTTIKLQNVLISLTIILSGIFYQTTIVKNKPAAFDRKDYFLAEVCQQPTRKAKTYQSILKIQNNSMTKPEKVIAYFSNDQFDSTITTGDQLVVLAKPQEIRNMGNPFEFDYQAMMNKKGIWHSVYLPEGTYLKTNHRFNRVTYLAERLRDKLISKLSAAKLGKKERAVVEALTLGYRADLDRETIDYFASTGAMHVLAVSGLHVGLIYFILGFLLSGLKRFKQGNYITPVALILFLWSYAFITGFSPSVQRATVMFTFIIIGNILRRPVNIYNTLTASALILILLNPDVIFEVGFQLSYLAVFGIVLIQPKLAGFIEVKNKFLKSLWNLLTVSIAAQLATFPLGLLYFNQFPNFFWLSNFFVIPGATLIIWMTFAFFIFTPIPFVTELIAKFIQWTTSILLEILRILSELPYAVSEGIIIKQLDAFLILGILISILILGFSKRKIWLFYAMSLVIFLQISQLTTKYQLINQKVIFAYNSPNLMVHLINGRTNYLITNGLDKITETDQNIVQKVVNHLKLNDPVIINRHHSGEFNFSDLSGSHDTFQFLSCKIQYNKQSVYQRQNNTGFITLEMNPGNSGTSSILKTISSGSSYFIHEKDTTNLYSTRLKGAYFLSLN